MDKNIDETQTKMDGALKSIEKMLKTKDRCQLCTIFALVVIFVIGALRGRARVCARARDEVLGKFLTASPLRPRSHGRRAQLKLGAHFSQRARART